jgi:hypothetical protein
MFIVGIFVGAGIAAPVFFCFGLFLASDRHVSHERADITPALRRSR